MSNRSIKTFQLHIFVVEGSVDDVGGNLGVHLRGDIEKQEAYKDLFLSIPLVLDGSVYGLPRSGVDREGMGGVATNAIHPHQRRPVSRPGLPVGPVQLDEADGRGEGD
jgi:hypothetical protein